MSKHIMAIINNTFGEKELTPVPNVMDLDEEQYVFSDYSIDDDVDFELEDI